MKYEKLKQKIFNSFRNFKQGKRRFSSFEQKLLNLKWPVYSYILMANAAMYFAWNSPFFSERFLLHNFALSKYNLSHLKLHTLFTYNFSHLSLFHLISNSIGIYFIGKAVEGIFGPKVFLTVFIAGGFFGGLLALLTSNRMDNRPLVGGSAGVSALFGFFVMNFPREKIFILPIPFPLPAWLVCTVFFWYSYRQTFNPYSQVSHAGHFGGLLTGLMYYFIYNGVVVL